MILRHYNAAHRQPSQGELLRWQKSQERETRPVAGCSRAPPRPPCCEARSRRALGSRARPRARAGPVPPSRRGWRGVPRGSSAAAARRGPGPSPHSSATATSDARASDEHPDFQPVRPLALLQPTVHARVCKEVVCVCVFGRSQE